MMRPLHIIRAGLIGSCACTAAGIAAAGNAPVIASWRELLAVGVDPDTALEVYRGGILALQVRSIGRAAGLEINSEGTAFVRCPVAVRTASPMRKSGLAVKSSIATSGGPQ